MFESKILRKIFDSKGDEQTDEWRKFHNLELHNLYAYGNPRTCIIRILKSRRLQWGGGKGHLAWMGDGRRAHKLLLGKLEGSYPHGRPKIRWKGNNLGFEGDIVQLRDLQP